MSRSLPESETPAPDVSRRSRHTTTLNLEDDPPITAFKAQRKEKKKKKKKKEDDDLASSHRNESFSNTLHVIIPPLNTSNRPDIDKNPTRRLQSWMWVETPQT